jgi:hypothetical protein
VHQFKDLLLNLQSSGFVDCSGFRDAIKSSLQFFNGHSITPFHKITGAKSPGFFGAEI